MLQRLILISFVFLSGCFLDPQVKSSADRISYGSDPRQHFDLYTKSGDVQPRPFILLIHGGAWVFGPPASQYESFFKPNNALPMKNFVQNLINAGYAVGIMKYRIPRYYRKDATPGNIPSAQSGLAEVMSDIDAAIGKAINNAAALKIDPSRIGILGESAGGHLALMFAYGNTIHQSNIKTVVSFYAPSDLSKPDALNDYYSYNYLGNVPKLFQVEKTATQQFGNSASVQEDGGSAGNLAVYGLQAFDSMTGTFIQNQASATRKNFSPVGLISNPSSLPPTLALHGSADQVVNPNQLDLLSSALGAQNYSDAAASSSTGARHLYAIIPGFNHGWLSSNLTQLPQAFDQNVGSKVIMWLNGRLKN